MLIIRVQFQLLVETVKERLKEERLKEERLKEDSLKEEKLEEEHGDINDNHLSLVLSN